MRAQLARVDAVLVQALIAAALSFAHLHDIALAAGQDGWKAWAYPVSVDLLLVAAWRRLRSGEAKAAGWCWFVIALAASLGANVATAGLLDMNDVPAWLRILVAGWPAVAFLGGTLLAHTTPTQVDENAEPADGYLDQEDAPELVPDLDSEAPPEPPPTPPAIEPPPPERPAVAVPAALVEHARKVAAEHHTRTGTPIDTPTLRARLGVPPVHGRSHRRPTHLTDEDTMRPFIQSALERSAELTRDNRLVNAVALAEAAIKRATPNEHREIEQWLTDHAHDFTGEDAR